MVDVEFAQPSYTVGENDGSVSVCIDISGAVLERNVTVFLSTEGFDATCKLLLILITYRNKKMVCYISCYTILTNFLSHIYHSL